MKLTTELKQMLNEDILKAHEALRNNSQKTLLEVHKELDGKYRPYFDDWGKSMFHHSAKLGFEYEGLYGGLNKYPESVLHNVEIMVSKLKSLQAQGEAFITKEQGIEINNSSTNSVTIDIDVSFEKAKESISNMTALPSSEIEEILDKISKLESIVKSPETKSKKWENAKNIVKWIADKGVDVGIALLPLLLQIG